MKINKKLVKMIICAVVIAVLLVQIISVPLFYHFALTPGHKVFSFEVESRNTEESEKENTDAGEEWVKKHAKQKTLKASDGTELSGYFIKNKSLSNSYAVICHPYSSSGLSMAVYAKHYYDLGFNILLPDARGHGKSDGKYIGMGWDDRFDVLEWVKNIVEDDENARILLHGVSMGAATVLMASGEDMPENVRCIIEDGAYSSVWAEFSYQLKNNFSLPSFPILYLESAYTKLRAGWNFKEASALEQVKKSKTPTLFIHADDDEFIPVSHCNDLYDACGAEKRQYRVTGARHGQSLTFDSTKYWGEVDRFMLKYFGIGQEE